MALRLYNTFTNSKEKFAPIQEGKVKFYVCGPTVYDYIHIGNGRAFIVGDVLRRFLTYLGYDVTYVMNLTDIDDRIIERATRDGVGTETITEKYTRAFFTDLDGLGVRRADAYPKATEHVPEIISLIQTLIDKELAYPADGDVFYDVSKFKAYGKLSGKKLEELIAGARVEVDTKKRNPGDFALWKSQKPGEPAWQSPWGLGRPGWHIECSAMSMKYLGSSFDIHAGGVDLVFPHHENEIAQSEGATGQRFVKHWLHNGFLQIHGDKMAKSLGNFKTVKDILKTVPGVAIRLFFLQKHYRNPIDFTEASVKSATSAAARLKIFYGNIKKAVDRSVDSKGKTDPLELTNSEAEFLSVLRELQSNVVASLEDDLDTPAALAYLFDIVRETNKILSKKDLTAGDLHVLNEALAVVEKINDIFGVIEIDVTTSDSQILDDVMNLMIEVRNELRSNKDWKLSDRVRDELANMGIVLEDKGGMTTWRLK